MHNHEDMGVWELTASKAIWEINTGVWDSRGTVCSICITSKDEFIFCRSPKMYLLSYSISIDHKNFPFSFPTLLNKFECIMSVYILHLLPLNFHGCWPCKNIITLSPYPHAPSFLLLSLYVCRRIYLYLSIHAYMLMFSSCWSSAYVSYMICALDWMCPPKVPILKP